MSKPTNLTHRLFGLDVVRASAIILVLFGHVVKRILPQFADPHTQHLGYLVLSFLGLFGVEIFFALSGFLIGGILLEQKTLNTETIKRFWVRRWLRTLPIYFIGLLCLIPLRGYGESIPYLYPFFLQMWDPLVASSALFNFFGPSWSLAVEEWFYLFLPLAFVALAISKGGRLAKLAGLYIGLVVFSLVMVYAYDINQQAARQITWLRFDALLVGVVARAALPYLSAAHIRGLAWLGTASIASMVALWVYVYPTWPEMPSNAFLKYPLFHVLPFGTACLLPYFNNLRVTPSHLTKLISWIAAISYPLYIVHTDVSLEIRAMVDGMWAYLVLSLAACFGLAHALHVGIEKPVLRWRDKRFPALGREEPSSSQALSYAARGMAVVVVVAVSVLVTWWVNPQTLPARMCPSSRMQAVYDRALGSMNARINMGRRLAFENLLACAARGDVRSYETLGDTMRLGWLDYKDPARALAYYEQAANLGSAKGAFESATAYRTGKGTDVNLPRAMELYKQAADHGDARALQEYDYIKAKLEQALPATME